ncbi:LuxR family transcriptional regulator [Mesorhizobium sp. C280B]|uniref:helix-turn-helix transcriptional regulator n=1 Tax=unclassified Mesorhizobium TaxID=325217 RepID=UPI0003CE2B92|nr:LuxR family transcriptional regulator [Mesorhizobium sp. LSJC280B00]ESW77820.1 LuxR family transcriptional regulator [Mesorhizobium sp. LSJC280B00]
MGPAANTARPGEAFAVEFGRFLEQTDGVAQSEQLFDLLSALALNFDCRWVSYDSISPGPEGLKSVRRDPAVLLNFPEEWQERYYEMGFDRIDPIIKTCRTRADAFRWSEVYKDVCTTQDERRVLDEAATFGLRSGISVPLHGPGRNFAIMSFAQTENGELHNRTITYLQFAALHFHRKVIKFASSSGTERGPDLSPRERECLSWIARGKSSWEIGQILEISLDTVNFHVKNVLRKMDTSNRTAAAVNAIRLGII